MGQEVLGLDRHNLGTLHLVDYELETRIYLDYITNNYQVFFLLSYIHNINIIRKNMRNSLNSDVGDTMIVVMLPLHSIKFLP